MGRRTMGEQYLDREEPTGLREALVVDLPPGRAPALIPRLRSDDDSGAGVAALSVDELVERVRRRDEEAATLLELTDRINHGLDLEQVLEFLYRGIRGIIPFDRVACSLIDESRGIVAAHWARSDRPIHLPAGFQAPLAGSTLQTIIDTRRPRIINDLAEYLRHKPQSLSTQLIVREGMRSSLTCPLIVEGKPVGFLFFNSTEPGAYNNAQIEIYQHIAGQLSVIVEKGRLYSELARHTGIVEQQNQQMTRELETARQLQRSLVPARPAVLPGLDVAFAYEPAIQIGGDVLDLTAMADGRSLVLLGDVMGHGVQAALVMSAVKAAFWSARHETHDPRRILGRINAAIHPLLESRFATATCVLMDPAKGWYRLALAGHASPLHYHADTGQITQPGQGGPPLGYYELEPSESAQVPLRAGDVLLLCTDGLTEAQDGSGSEYGHERLREVLRRHRASLAVELLDVIRADLAAHCGQRALADDLTVLVFKALPRV